MECTPLAQCGTADWVLTSMWQRLVLTPYATNTRLSNDGFVVHKVHGPNKRQQKPKAIIYSGDCLSSTNSVTLALISLNNKQGAPATASQMRRHPKEADT